jgi:hypothetical protein
LVDDLAVGEAGGELFERAADFGDAVEDGGVGSNGDVVFGEVDAGFEQRDQFDELLLDWLQALLERAFQLLGGDLGLEQRL